ncbi:arabinogalactan O-methyltransferase 1-like [Malania oleifera]|uniref:arabinogalactan O-methyltransferase 1-like n=1 Tax=Malania oleifera TaxID=397392 RepID=UPI0025AEA21F|nr:arabinogalactan O-methyltransferase 1-like [Malania oleifera]
MKNRIVVVERPWFLCIVMTGALAGALLIGGFIRISDTSLPCSVSSAARDGYSAADDGLIRAILHYATSRVVPQQSRAEIRVSFAVLRSLSPCNFLVFGLGHDSLMWASFNSRGTTLFLEEDPRWVQAVLKNAPDLRARAVEYPTRLSDADELLKSYRLEPDCSPTSVPLRDSRCRLALPALPGEVYDTEWDAIMIDAPRGFFAAAPGRMGAIFTAAAMARGRTRRGVTHVFLHDVNRRVERVYAEEFLCRKYLVKAVGRLWHFEIPASNGSDVDGGTTAFC